MGIDFLQNEAHSAHDFAVPQPARTVLISLKRFMKPFCESRFPHRSVNLFFILVILKNKLRDLWRN